MRENKRRFYLALGRAVLKVNIFVNVSTLMGNDSLEKVTLSA